MLSVDMSFLDLQCIRKQDSEFGVDQFLGIPYGTALRFGQSTPLPYMSVLFAHERITNIYAFMHTCCFRRSFNATSLGPICPQKDNFYSHGLPQSEGACRVCTEVFRFQSPFVLLLFWSCMAIKKMCADCLSLNVYSAMPRDKKQPVMIWMYDTCL